MWYVIQVHTGKEQETVLQCQKLVSPAVLGKSFLPYYKAMKRYQGEWHMETRILFPGYVFLVTDQPERLFLELKKVPGLTKLLGTGEEIVPLTLEEITYLQRIGRQDQIVEMSTGVIDNGELQVLEGPLAGMEKSVKKIDRHKRKAWVEMKLFGKVVETVVGLEIVEKR